MATLFTLPPIVIIMFFIASIISLLNISWGIFMLAKNQELANTWMAWVPVLSFYKLGEIIDKRNNYFFRISLPVLLLINIALCLGGVNYAAISLLFQIVLLLFMAIANVKVFIMKMGVIPAIILAIFFQPVGWLIVGEQSH